MTTIKALLAEDEPLLRAQLRHRLAAAWPELSISAEAENGQQALELFAELQPQIVFLDIHMPLLSGVEVARRLSGKCHIVFVTAFDQYAVQAFEQGAVDYVLKPVTAERMAVTIERLKERIHQPPQPIDALLERLNDHLRPSANYLRWIKASLGSSLKLIAVDEVIYFQAEDKYTKVIISQGEALIKTPIKELQATLDPEMFWQIHRATIVNVQAIASVGRDYRDQPIIKLKDRPETLTVSRTFAHLFKQM